MKQKQISPMTIRIPPKLKAELEEVAADQEITQVQLILTAIRFYLDNR